MKHARGTTLHHHQRTLFYLAATFVMVATSVYMYFVCIAVVHVVARTETDGAITRMKTRITNLEERYIQAEGAVTFDTATVHGFVPTKEKVYIRRAPDTLVLSTNDES